MSKVTLLGSAEKLDWTQTAEGLAVQLPAQRPCDFAWGLRIEGVTPAQRRPKRLRALVD